MTYAKLLHIFCCILLVTVFSCCGEKEAPPVTSRCALDPDPGPCEAYFPKYYYDKQEKKCKEFIWGGCGGVVPFETLEACKGCE